MTNPVPLSANHRLIYLNASALKTLDCSDKFMLTCVEGYRPVVENPVFNVGKALHKYAELVATGEDDLVALTKACAMPGVTDKAQIANASSGYRRAGLNKPALIAGAPLVEHRFAVKFSEHIVDDITYEVYLTGRFDLIADTRLGIEITDYKSTRKRYFDEVVASYADDVQFLFYYTVARRFAYEVFNDPIIAEKAWQGKLFTRLCAIMLYAKPSPAWRLGPLWAPTEERYEEFLEGLRTVIVPHIVRMYAGRVSYQRDGLYKNLCPQCRLSDLCLRGATNSYVQSPYDPLSW